MRSKDRLIGDGNDWTVAKKLLAAEKRHLEVEILALFVALLAFLQKFLLLEDGLHHALHVPARACHAVSRSLGATRTLLESAVAAAADVCAG